MSMQDEEIIAEAQEDVAVETEASEMATEVDGEPEEDEADESDDDADDADDDQDDQD